MKKSGFLILIIITICFYYGCSNYALHRAIDSGNKSEFVELLKSDTDLNRRNQKGQTPLDLAVLSGNLDFVKTLLDAGASINENAVFYAVSNKDFNIVFLLLNRIPDVNKISIDKESLLHRACIKENYSAVNLLLKKGAKVNARDKNQNTPLMLSCTNDNTDIVKSLINFGADVNLSNKDGETALHTAAINNCLRVIKFLLIHGANPNLVNKNSYTPIHAALFVNNNEIVNEFLEHEVNAYIIGKKDIDLLITAKLYKAYGDYYTNKGYLSDAAESYQVSVAYFDKAYRTFSKKSKDYSDKATTNTWLNVLSFVGAAAQAYGSALTSPYGGGVGIYSIRETGSLEDIAESYRIQADSCLKYTKMCNRKIKCFNNKNKTIIKQCIESKGSVQSLSNQDNEVDSSFLQIFIDTSPFERYEKTVIDSSTNKTFAHMLSPTYKLMIKGSYDNTRDTNVELARRSSLEQFIKAFLNAKQLGLHFTIIKNERLIEDSEIFIGFTEDCILTSKRLYLFDDNKLTRYYDMSSIKKIRYEPGLLSVTKYIEFANGESIEIDESIPNDYYIQLIKENNL